MSRSLPYHLLIYLALAAQTACAGLWSLKGPQMDANAGDAIRLLEREIKDANYPAAARRLAGLLQNRTEPLVEVEEARLLSIGAWLQTLPAEPRHRLAQHCENDAGAAASQALDTLRTNARSRPEEFHALWRQHPLTDAGRSALVEAADRAAALGDAPAALAYCDLAIRLGWTPAPARTPAIEALRRLRSGQFIPLPGDSAEPASRPDRPRHIGAVPFDAPWYNNSAAWGQNKFLPLEIEDRYLLASWKNTSLLREMGQVVWTTPNPRAPGSLPPARGDAPGPIFTPAILLDAHGRPSLIVVRQPGAMGDQQYVLRALRGATGKELWRTESVDRKTAWSYAGSPAVAGRFVYALAVARNDFASVSLALASFDLLTGQPHFTAPLGTLTVTGEPLETGAMGALPEPALDGDLAIVAPNGGVVVATDRFDGSIRWVYPYRKSTAERDRLGAGFIPRKGNEAALAPGRFKTAISVSGDVVVVVPQDSPVVLGLDRLTGALRWRFDDNEVCALAGIVGKWAVLGGTHLMGVDITNGKRTWKYTAPASQLTGPPIVSGTTAVGPTARGLIYVNASDGKDVPAIPLLNFKRFLISESGKAALREANAERAFGTR